MEAFLRFVLIIFVVVAGMSLINIALTIKLHYSTKKILSHPSWKEKPDSKFILENIIYSRTGLRGIYSGFLIITSVLAILGIKGIGDIRNEVSNQILRESRADLDTAQRNFTQMKDLLREVQKTSIEASGYFHTIKKSPQKVFFVDRVVVGAHSKKIHFTEMKTIDGEDLPTFAKPPFAFICNSHGMGSDITNVTKDYLEIIAVDTALIDLCVSIR